MQKFTLLALFGVYAAALLPNPLMADVRLPQLVSDGMVLQRDTPVPVWGWADPGEAVRVEFRGERYTTEADAEGHWEVTLPPQGAGGPEQLVVEGNNRITLNDVLVGDIWLASGQSNMELPMGRTKTINRDEMARADFPEIRYFYVPDRYNFKAPEVDLDGGEWVAITPETVWDVAAVVYFFAKDLHQHTGVPIGVMNAALGGSPIEAWISEEGLKAFPHHLEEGKRFRDDDLIDEITLADQSRAAQWDEALERTDRGLRNGSFHWARSDYDHSDWDTIELPRFWSDPEEPVNGVWWLRKTIEVPDSWAGKPAFLNLGTMTDADATFLNGELVGRTWYQYPPRWYRLPEGVLKAGTNTLTVRLVSESGRPGFWEDKDYELEWQGESIDLTGEWHYRLGAQMPAKGGSTFIRWKPLGLYNGMIAPLHKVPFTGVIWYQGESNAGRYGEYAELFETLIEDWRGHWNNDELPFLFVQLANYMAAHEQPTDSHWARLREAQKQTLGVAHTGMAVAIDVGEWNDIHPLDKASVGERLALAARAIAYGEENLVYSGPLFKEARVRRNRIDISFEHTGGGLASCDGEPLQHFAIAGEDGEFVWAQARIRGDRIQVSNPEVRRPQMVRYAWADNPEGANLCNREGLPASPFRTDEQPVSER
ncbi:sialate O-acetylesterase [Marinimicrobium alkaliphilum]|uniref:sialate O-acetylesterase n=1 Tax=Marinimicrobium alkaliphilum TaxID=2202654 RepID=UPI000DB97967|nr:sialate O-acetylesterase [Marinimicrobium alkaliphilum]